MEQSKHNIQLLFLRKILRRNQMQDGVRICSKLGIGIVKYEVCSNLVVKWFRKVMTVKKNSSNCKILVNGRFQYQEICTHKTESNYTQMEQILPERMLLSGGFSSKRFSFFSLRSQQEYEMNFYRYWHRTSFNQRDAVYIISGGCVFEQLRYMDVVECELFKLSQEKFSCIQSIQTSVQTFGCDQTIQSIYVFGGYNQQISYQDIIQVYNKKLNSWTYCQQVLTIKASVSSVLIPRRDSFLIYKNGFVMIDTQMFDLKSLSLQGQRYPSSFGYDYTQPILNNNQVYQYDCESQLLIYSLSSGIWTQV